MGTGDLRNSLSRADGQSTVPKRFKNQLGIIQKLIIITTNASGDYFILDHPTNSILDGTNILDDNYTILTEQIYSPNNKYQEDFGDYSIYNTSSSTCTMNDFEVLFDTDEELISNCIYKNSETSISTLTFDFSNVDTNLDFSSDELYLSNDGTTWTLCDDGENTLSDLSLDGDEIYYKIKAKNDSRYLRTKQTYYVTTLNITYE